MIHIHTSPEPLQESARALNALLDECRAQDVLLLFSGGSALDLLPHVDTTLLTERDTLSVLDERYTCDAEVSNFSQLVATPFWERAAKQHVQAIDPRPDDNERLADAARRFDVALKHWHITHHDGVVIATMGVGPDGHTSGVLPMPENPDTFQELFFDTHTCIRGYHVNPRKNQHPDRLTTTLSYLRRRVDHAVVYAQGVKKQKALEALMADAGSIETTPARILRDMRNVHIYSDCALG